MVQFVFGYQQLFQSYELLKVTIFQHVKLRKWHLQVFHNYTNPPGFSERRNCPNMWQVLKEAMMLLLVTPCPCCWSKIVTMKPAVAPQHQLSCRSSVPLLWQPHPFHVVFTERLSAWARNCLSVWRRIVRTHLRCNLKISKIQISNCFHVISLRHMGGLCKYGHIYKDIWYAVVGEVLVCEREPNNFQDSSCKKMKNSARLIFAHEATREIFWLQKLLKLR